MRPLFSLQHPTPSFCAHPFLHAERFRRSYSNLVRRLFYPPYNTSISYKYLKRELAYFQREGLAYQHWRGIYSEYHLRNSLSYPYNLIIPPLLGVAFRVCLLVLLYYLLDNDHAGWVALVMLYFVYHYGLKLWQVNNPRQSS
jgi:hypothetical protein